MESMHTDLKRFNCLTAEIDAVYHDAALRLGLSDSALMILYTVCTYGESCLLYDITRLSGVSKQTIHSALHKLADEGVVYLEPVSGRKKRVCLTETGKAFADVTVSDLSSGFVIGNVKLSSVVNPTDAKLVALLEQATGKAFADIILSDLDSGFNTDNVKLTAFLPVAGNEGLYNCLIDAMGVSSADEITIGSLDGGFNINDIKLKTVLPSSSSSIVQALIEQDTTIGNLGTAVDRTAKSVENTGKHIGRNGKLHGAAEETDLRVLKIYSRTAFEKLKKGV